jgi:hypothetical protein
MFVIEKQYVYFEVGIYCVIISHSMFSAVNLQHVKAYNLITITCWLHIMNWWTVIIVIHNNSFQNIARSLMFLDIILPNTMEQISHEKLWVLQLVKNFHAFYGTKLSLPCSQQPNTFHYPEPDESCLHVTHHFPKNRFSTVLLLSRYRLEYIQYNSFWCLRSSAMCRRVLLGWVDAFFWVVATRSSGMSRRVLLGCGDAFFWDVATRSSGMSRRVLLGCGDAFFWDVATRSSGMSRSVLLGCGDAFFWDVSTVLLGCVDAFFWDVATRSSAMCRRVILRCGDAAPHPRRTQTSNLPLQTPKNS